MALIKKRAITEDSYRVLANEEPVPQQGDVFVSLAQLESCWNEEEGALQRKGKTGVWVSGETEPELLRPYLSSLDAVALEIPRYTDGRAYSTARLLRRRFGFDGEIRAVGHVLRDQLSYLERCGVDAFVLAPGQSERGALEAFGEFSVRYQPDALPVQAAEGSAESRG